MRTIRIIMCVLVLMLSSAAQLLAQQARVVGSDELNAAVLDHAAAAERERARLSSLLERPDVADIAERHGLDIDRVRDAAATLSAEDLKRLAPLTQGITGELVGGQTLVISATTLIIILLLVILIIVAT